MIRVQNYTKFTLVSKSRYMLNLICEIIQGVCSLEKKNKVKGNAFFIFDFQQRKRVLIAFEIWLFKMCDIFCNSKVICLP